MASFVEIYFQNATKLSKHDLIKALFFFASLLVCSTKARLVPLTKTQPVRPGSPQRFRPRKGYDLNQN
jgi:hypothetical protein